jgi:hypothetical protein
MVQPDIKEKVAKCFKDNDPIACAESIYSVYGYLKGVQVIEQISKEAETGQQTVFVKFWTAVKKCSLN